MGKNAPALGSFNAGELSPDMAGRVELDKYPAGCDTLLNFIPRVQGPGRRRPGTRYVQPVKSSANRTWLRKFIFSQSQAYQVEFGPGYCRFYTNHGQVQVSGVAAYAGGTTYAVGDLVLSGGIHYYCIAVTTGNAPPNATYWYALTGTIYEIPTPYTAGMLTNTDNTCGLQIEQSGDVLYITCSGYLPMTLTRRSATKWIMTPYWPTDGPFMDQNIASAPALYLTAIAGQNLQATCTATAAVFDPTDVATAAFPGRLVRIDVQYFNVAPWQTAHAYAVNDLARYNGNTYKALNAATSGGGAAAAGSPPTHTSGTAFDAPGGVQWLYQDSGYGIGRVTAYASSTSVTLTFSPNASGAQYYNFPAATYGSVKGITGITAANPAVVTSVAHGLVVGDWVYITAAGGMTQINDQMYTLTAVTPNTFTLGAVDASAYSAWTAGGSAIKNASLRWQLGAWGYGATAYAAQLPTALAFFGDRLFLGTGIRWWGSAPGLYSSHTQDLFSLITAACAIRGIIAAQEVDSITWMNAANVLLIGTKGGEFGLSAITNTQPIGPGNVQVPRQSKYRSRQIRAELIGTSNFYVQASGKKLMSQDYNFYIDRYDSTNQNRIANHIAGYTVAAGIIDIAYHSEPYECLWCVRADGALLGYTFDRADNVTGWHRHAMGGTLAGIAVVECVSVIPAPDGTRDEVWLIVNRTIGGVTVRSVEYLEKDYETGDAQNTICYVDMSGSYNGVPTTTITGLSYLNGERVSVVIDGGGHPDCVVSGGQITLDIAASVVQVGLACPADLITMRPEGGADIGTAQGKMKRTAIVTFRFKNTLGGYAGNADGPLDLINLNQTTTPLGQAPPLFNGDVRQSFPGDFELDGRIRVYQPQPFPMELIAIFPIITVNEPSP